MADAKMGLGKAKDVGAAKGTASPGSDNSAMDASLKDKQMPGGKRAPVKASESASPSSSGNAGRGMSSPEADAAYKKAGLKVPTSQKDGWR
jgi:hypothetical protein